MKNENILEEIKEKISQEIVKDGIIRFDQEWGVRFSMSDSLKKIFMDSNRSVENQKRNYKQFVIHVLNAVKNL